MRFYLKQGSVMIPALTNPQSWRPIEPAGESRSPQELLAEYCPLPLPGTAEFRAAPDQQELGRRAELTTFVALGLMFLLVLLAFTAPGVALDGVDRLPGLKVFAVLTAAGTLVFLRKVQIMGNIVITALLTVMATGTFYFACNHASLWLAPQEQRDFVLAHNDDVIGQVWQSTGTPPTLSFSLNKTIHTTVGTHRQLPIHHGPFNIYTIRNDVLHSL